MSIQNVSLQFMVASAVPVGRHDSPNTHTKFAHLHAPRKTRHMPPSLPLPGKTREPTRILIVIVDDADSTAPLEDLLHGLGYWTTKVASCGETALILAQDFFPAVVLLALDLPGMSAYHVAQRLRERTQVPGLRLIALTGDFEHAGRDLAREAGFERYLAKPVSVAALQQLLRAGQP
jgi:CheY-like chemotaxis protein